MNIIDVEYINKENENIITGVSFSVSNLYEREIPLICVLLLDNDSWIIDSFIIEPYAVQDFDYQFKNISSFVKISVSNGEYELELNIK